MGLTSVISKLPSPLHLIHPASSSSSSVAVLHLFHIPAITILHGFQCFVAVGYEAEEQASFRRFNPDQEELNVLLKNTNQNDTRRLVGIVCSTRQESSEISAQVWPSFSPMQGLVQFDLEFVF